MIPRVDGGDGFLILPFRPIESLCVQPIGHLDPPAPRLGDSIYFPVEFFQCHFRTFGCGCDDKMNLTLFAAGVKGCLPDWGGGTFAPSLSRLPVPCVTTCRAPQPSHAESHQCHPWNVAPRAPSGGKKHPATLPALP